MIGLAMESKRSLTGSWWGNSHARAQMTYASYLSMSETQRQEPRPAAALSSSDVVIERQFVTHLIHAMPDPLGTTILQNGDLSGVAVLVNAMIDAGPGTRVDRAATL